MSSRIWVVLLLLAGLVALSYLPAPSRSNAKAMSMAIVSEDARAEGSEGGLAVRPVSASASAPAPASGGAPVSAKSNAPVVAPTAAEPDAPVDPLPGTVAELAPSVDQVRAEIARNPDAPSPTMTAFAVELERKIAAALESESTSQTLFAQLDDCVTNARARRLAEAARVRCLLGADRIASQYPDFKARYENLELRAEPRLVSLKRSLDF